MKFTEVSIKPTQSMSKQANNEAQATKKTEKCKGYQHQIL